MTQLSYFFCCLSLLLLFSCRETPLEDSQAPLIKIEAPLDNSSFTNGEAISIQASIEENEELHTYSIRVLTPGNGEVKFEVEKHEHGQQIDVTETFTPDVKLTTDFLIRIEAEDHNGNASTAERSFTVSL